MIKIRSYDDAPGVGSQCIGILDRRFENPNRGTARIIRRAIARKRERKGRGKCLPVAHREERILDEVDALVKRLGEKEKAGKKLGTERAVEIKTPFDVRRKLGIPIGKLAEQGVEVRSRFQLNAGESACA